MRVLARQKAVLLLIALLLIAGCAYLLRVRSNSLDAYVMPSMTARFDYYVDEGHPSRSWLNYVKSVMQDHEYPPAEAARAYAYIASLYSDVYEKTGDQAQAIRAPWYLIPYMYPYTAPDPTLMLIRLQGDREVTLSEDALAIVADYKERWSKEPQHDRTPDTSYTPHMTVDIPSGEAYWRPVNEKGKKVEPINPDAGTWQRWILDSETFNMPAPPAVGSAADQEQIRLMKASVGEREAWRDRIFKWWGGKGTGTPAWMWLDIFYQTHGKDMDDRELARYQKAFAQALADTFIICWDKKYTYWSARPFQRIEGFKPIAETPFFPGYPSGHSTVSAAAATILGAWFPESADEYMAMAEEARDTRLYAGIHFEVDNTNGFTLGKDIGERVLKRVPKP